MAQITQAAAGRNVPAFLDLIGYSEGTATSALTHDRGYDIIVGGVMPDKGVETFTDYSKHPFEPSAAYPHGRPSKIVRPAMGTQKALISSASGRYQFELATWLSLRRMLHLTDFSPISQDKGAMELIGEHRDAARVSALEHIQRGDIATAITLCSRTWASFPGNLDGQGGKTMAQMLAQFEQLDAAYAHQEAA